MNIVMKFCRSECLRTTTFCSIAIILGIMLGYYVFADRNVDSMVYFKAERSKDYNTRFAVVGDWGRKGHDHQRDVALQMALVSEVLRPNFIVSTGDNFYPSGKVYADNFVENILSKIRYFQV